MLMPWQVLALVRELGLEGAEKAIGVLDPAGLVPAAAAGGGFWDDGSRDARLRELVAAGWTDGQIAAELGLASAKQVANRLHARHSDLVGKRSRGRRPVLALSKS